MTYLSNTFTKNTKKVVFVWLEDKLFRCLRSCHMRCFFLAIIIIKCSLHRGTKSSDCINPVCIRRGIRSSTLGLGRFMIYMHCVVYPAFWASTACGRRKSTNFLSHSVSYGGLH